MQQVPFSTLDVRTDTQYDGICLRNLNSNKLVELAGLDEDNENGSLSLYSGAEKEVQLRGGDGNNWVLGNLGVGTKSPYGPLTVHSNIESTSSAAAELYNSCAICW